jgi:hypothetical protein
VELEGFRHKTVVELENVLEQPLKSLKQHNKAEDNVDN